jgi:hypothetical protein
VKVFFVALFDGIWVNGGGKLGMSTLGLVHVGDILGVCGGVIQNSDQQRFCCKAAETCSVKGHKSSKINLAAETLYMKHLQNGHAHLEPSLLVNLLPDDMPLVKILGKDLGLEIWKVGELKRSSTSSFESRSPWEEVEIPMLESQSSQQEKLQNS